MYSEYWNLIKPPFDNVPDSSMYVDCHVSMEDVIAETIYAIKEGNECLTVIVGEVGLGKTLSLRVIIDSLEPEKYKVALITNPALSFIQLLREIIGQITGKQCLEKKKVDLLEIFNRLLFETADQGKKIVIVIDEANVLSPSVLDDVRLLTNMQDDDRNLFTLLLVGQMEFARMLERPKHANLFQRVGTYGHLEKLPSKDAVQSYIEARLKIAGTEKKIFTDDAISVIWEFSEHGVPRLINKICKLCLKAGETNEFATINAEVAAQIADRFQKLGKTARRTPSRPASDLPERKTEEAAAEKLPKRTRSLASKPETPEIKPSVKPTPPSPVEEAIPVQPPVRPAPQPIVEDIPVQPRPVIPEQPPVRPAPQPIVEDIPVQPRPVIPEQPPVRPAPQPIVEDIPVQPRPVIPEQPPVRPAPQPIVEDIPVQPRPVIPQQPPVRPAPQPIVEDIPVQPRPVIPQQPPVRQAPQPIVEDIPVQPRPVIPQQPPVRPAPQPIVEDIPVQPRPVIPQQPPVRPAPFPAEEAPTVQLRPAMMDQKPVTQQEPEPLEVEDQGGEIVSTQLRPIMPGSQPVQQVVPEREEAVPFRSRTVPFGKPTVVPFSPRAEASASQPRPIAPPRPPVAPIPTRKEEPLPAQSAPADSIEPPAQEDNESYEDVLIGQNSVKLTIPAHVIRNAQTADPETKNKLAGYWSAQILKGNPQLAHTSADPVSLWFDVKNVILKKFNSR